MTGDQPMNTKPSGFLRRLGERHQRWDFVLALAGNPNTGKSTLFNALTGLRQHTGNWPGKTVVRAEGGFAFHDRQYKVVDLPGTYSLLSTSVDEEVARDFILFGKPDCTVVVVDATCLERNLNLVLQVLGITSRVVVALNLVDEARRKGVVVDHQALAAELGVPVIPVAARTEEGLPELLTAVAAVVGGDLVLQPCRMEPPEPLRSAAHEVADLLRRHYPSLSSAPWVALRLLDGDQRVREALRQGEWGERTGEGDEAVAAIITRAEEWRVRMTVSLHEYLVQAIYTQAEGIARRVVRRKGQRYGRWDQAFDHLLTSPWTGFPIMAACLAVIFWLTITGANYPSQLIAQFLFWIEDLGSRAFEAVGLPWWVTGFLWHGVYRGLAWVVAVMLPPMAIFFPLFTIMEDWGFLPRVAFNMDRLFKTCGAHGKQALTMSMGFGCNAAAIVSTRIIESPRERLIAILTNNFVPCNGRFPTLIMLANVFVAASVPAGLAALAAAGSVMGIILLGVVFTLIISALLSRTVLKGEPSSFTLELPPFRRPNIARVFYTSFIDRTVFVLHRAVMMAMPAGGVIWLLSHIQVGGSTLTSIIAAALDPLGRSLGLDGVILLAYIIAIPANEIVIPTILMAYTQAGMMIELDSTGELRQLLIGQEGWTLLTAVCLMLFALLHNPCSTTIWTIWKETRSVKWTALSALMPLAVAFAVTFAVAQTARMLGIH